MKIIQKILLVTAILFAGSYTASAEDMLDQIKAAKKIRIAVVLGTPLFSFAGADMKPTGSDIETAKMLAADLGVETEFVEITTAARVPTIQTGKADILVASLSITPERLKVIDFTIPYATLDIIVAAKDGMTITDYAGLKGKRIGVTRATINDTLITQNAKDAEIVRFEDDATLISAVVSGQVDIVSTQWPLVAVMNGQLKDKPLKTQFTMREMNLGIAMPQNEERLREWINGWVKTNIENGRLTTMFKKYHGRDLPADLVARPRPS